MIVLNENGKLDISKLEVTNPLPSSMIKKYNFNNMRNEFHELLELMQENYYIHVCYQEFLKYSIDEELNFIVLEDPMYNVETVDNFGRKLKGDASFRVYTKNTYKKEIVLCEELLYRVRDSYNNLDEVEKFIIKNFEFMVSSQYTDEVLMDELMLYKDKYYDSKKSAYIKLGLQLNLDHENRKDEEIKEYLLNYISKNCIVTLENEKV